MEFGIEYPLRGNIMLLLVLTFSLFSIFGMASVMTQMLEYLGLKEKISPEKIRKIRECGILYIMNKACERIGK